MLFRSDGLSNSSDSSKARSVFMVAVRCCAVRCGAVLCGAVRCCLVRYFAVLYRTVQRGFSGAHLGELAAVNSPATVGIKAFEDDVHQLLPGGHVVFMTSIVAGPHVPLVIQVQNLVL